MSTIDWTQGQLITLGPGDTASCNQNLNNGELYALFFYNAAAADAPTTVVVTGALSINPVIVTVPGTTQNLGLAALCFVNGTDTNSIQAAVTDNQIGAQIQAFIGSVKMPLNTSGISNIQLPLTGVPQKFQVFTRFFAVPESHFYEGEIESSVDQFISVQFTDQQALVNIVNSELDPSPVISYFGTSQQFVTVTPVKSQTLTWTLQGNGQQFVWINADSVQNSQSATISMQSI